ncbi:MAG: CCA tRNA nucleotidyltransferase [Ignavibacteriales bacterium]|nr:MAG: HD domain-containing protein [Ignavibacteriaceae bacterium]MBW7872885.1 HD domain-containing protein [Ignavibacteria bacterium]MCZ2142486.1 CCA tRNA nucleotidyltransferase [Ignavibacteriales bacterium]OQY76172.1 MAG: tRNA nucleotidyltransferase [Ignavibacteriales bacterium UTCHB3]MBV6445367.1 Multifunctional CCA protein [Ignavibacteriaceae bacterium]
MLPEEVVEAEKKVKENIKNLSFISEATRLADQRKEKVFIVGGYLRDLILEDCKKEIDILVVGDGTAYAEELGKRLNAEDVRVYGNFGTANFKFGDYSIEFVAARKESYSKESRNPEVTPATFEEDISRRDFTINAIAASVNSENFGKLFDLFNGLQDIKDKLIRTPLDPDTTFDDDPLRIMRAFRFAAKLGFTILPEILSAIKRKADRLSIISQERITDEFLKILASANPGLGLKLMFETGVMRVVFPEIHNLGGVEQVNEYHHKDVFYHTCEVVDNIAKVTDDVWLRFAALVHDIAKPQTKRLVEGVGWTFHGHEELGAKMMREIFKRMKFPFSKLPYVKRLVRLHLRPVAVSKDDVTDSAIRRLIVEAGEDLDDLLTLCRADITSKNENKVKNILKNYEKVAARVLEVREKDALRAFQSPVRGEEIMAVLGIKPGREVGIVKKAIEEAILEGVIPNEHDAAFKYMNEVAAKLINKGE